MRIASVLLPEDGTVRVGVVVDDRVHGVKPLLRLSGIRISRDRDRDLAVEEVTLQLRGHDGALLSRVS